MKDLYTIIGIDPGLAFTGWSVFQIPQSFLRGRGTASTTQLLRCLTDAGEITTTPQFKDPVRLWRLSTQVSTIMHQVRPDLVYVELPPFAGSYTGDQRRMADVSRLYMATGAIMAMTGTRAVGIPALRGKKPRRHQELAEAARIARVTLPSGPRGGRLTNAYDAVWLVVKAAEGRLMKDLFSPDPAAAPPKTRKKHGETQQGRTLFD